MKRNSFFLAAFLGSCSLPQGHGLNIDGFDKRLWALDSMGCHNKRHRLAKVLMDNEVVLIGRTKEDIESLLGRPNIDVPINGQYSFYYVEPGTQCWLPASTEIESGRLMIEYSKGIVVRFSYVLS